MGIGHYIKDIGQGKEGARDISRTQAADLMGQMLDAQVSPLELGAFCIAMRIKGETPDEMAGISGCRAPAHAAHPGARRPAGGRHSQLQRRPQAAAADDPCWHFCSPAKAYPYWCTAPTPKPAGFLHKMCSQPSPFLRKQLSLP
jgi:hypothetical protein